MGKDLPRIAETQLDADDARAACWRPCRTATAASSPTICAHPDGKWQQFTEFKDRIVQVLFGPHDDLFMVSLRDAPRGKIEHVPIADLGKKQPRSIVPEGEDAIVTSFFEMPTIVATPERLYVVYQLGGPSEIRAFDHEGKPVDGPSKTPVAAFFDLGAARRRRSAVRQRVVREAGRPVSCFTPNRDKTIETALASNSPVNLDDVEVRREFATSKDGTKVPVNIMFRKGTPRDGKNPCLATGYGGYGVSITPGFVAQPAHPARSTASCSPWPTSAAAASTARRGTWRATSPRSKTCSTTSPRCCEHLIERKYTSQRPAGDHRRQQRRPARWARSLTQHPELMKAVVSLVGIYDMLRGELSPNGEFNVTEFGTVKDLDQFRAFHAYSPYHHVKRASTTRRCCSSPGRTTRGSSRCSRGK